ncbi:DUF4349 domain-containing protein [Planobispora siamensis]|uniref:DUF4349 domain-containing protein n=1 Tax=Planobispora siamensis TaxID=936338 RepID=A0A8J3WIS1_9ACTN|nr:DUF4349 domain-containing protein [Planobispora siamensis]GIH90740.1 hypothetical protein Psi01_13700 [Planobispora siamensis]
MSRFRYGPRLAIAIAGLAVLVSACGSADTQNSSDAPAAPAAGEFDSQGGDAGGAENAAPQATSAPKREESTGQVERVEAVPTDRAIVYTANMTVRVTDVVSSADKAKQIVVSAGGYLAQEKSDAYEGGSASSTLVFKVPPTGYSGVVGRLGKELGKQESIQQSTEDVTEEVADVESRLKSAQSALDSLRTLLKQAKTIGQVLEVEREIANREAELESLQARQKKLASLTSMATLTLNLIGPAAEVPAPPEEEPGGFLGGLAAGWKAFVTALKVALTVLGALLPWLLVIVPVWLALYWVLRRRGRNRQVPPGPARGPLPHPGPPPPGGQDPDAPGQAGTGEPAQPSAAGPRVPS